MVLEGGRGWIEYLPQKLLGGGDYSREETISGNTVSIQTHWKSDNLEDWKNWKKWNGILINSIIYTVQSPFRDIKWWQPVIQWLLYKDYFSFYYIKAFDLVTLCDVVTVFVETICVVAKSRLHCTYIFLKLYVVFIVLFKNAYSP